MTLRFVLDGVGMGDTVVRLDGIDGLTSAADGTISFAGIKIEDPGGTLDLAGFHSFAVIEDACAVPRIFTGYIADKGISRGEYRNGAARVWDMNVVDLNGVLHLNVLHSANDKRKAETAIARVDYVLNGPLNGLVYDNGGVDRSGSDGFDEADYRGQYADDVLNSVTGGFKIFYVDWDETAPAGHEVSLYWQEPTAIVRTSTLRISNVAADSSYGTSLTTFAPFIDATLARSPDDQYGSLYTRYKTGAIYTERASTIAAMGVTRGFVFESERIGKLATANRVSAALLDTHALETDVITVTLKLPRAQVNLVRQGDRIECKFSHLPGLATFDFRRVERRTVKLAPDNEEFYYVTLTLSNKAFSTGAGGAGPAGGGDPDPAQFPHQPGSHYYSGEFVFVEDTGGWAAGSGGGSTTVSTTNPNGAVFTANTVYNYEITMIAAAPTNYAPNLQLQSVFSYPPNPAANMPPLNGGLPSPTGISFTKSGTMTTGSPITTSVQHLNASVAGSHGSTLPVTVTFWFDPVGWTGTVAPAPAQWVFNETPSPAPGGGRQSFATAWPFAAGSLKVRVDDVDQTAAIVSSSGGVPITGDLSDPSVRGPQAYTPTAATATVAAPYGAAQAATAIAAAGVNGTVTFPHAGSPYNFNLTTGPAGQKWQFAQPDTFFNGTITVNTTGIWLSGGRVANLHLTRPTQSCAGFHLSDCWVKSTSGYGIQIEGSHNNVLIERNRFSGQSLDPIHITYDVAPDGNMNNFIVRDNIMSTDNGHSMVSGNEGGGLNDLTNYKLLNNDINAGSRGAGNGFGIELWGGVNGEVAYNDLRGGGFLMSTVRSQGIFTHHNRGTLAASGAYAFYEAGGADHTGAVIAYNVVDGDGTGAFIYHDAGSNSCAFKFNRVTNVQYFVQGNGAGGGYTVEDNYYAGVNSFIDPNASWGTPNIVNRNGPGYGPVSGGTFTLNFDPRSDEVLTVDYQGI